MGNLPELTGEQVEQLLPGITSAELIGRGGQKLVFRALHESRQIAVKFSKIPELDSDIEEEFSYADVALRAKREVETMREVASPHMVKLGSLDMDFVDHGGEPLLYFSEELIDGDDLRTLLRRDGRLSIPDVVTLGLHITDAVKAIWAIKRIHRDIKPANIMRRTSSGDFVLLDAGLVFDLLGDTLSIGPVGTPPYFSPEQFDFSVRRTGLDFRSDIFSLGVTMYEMVTGKHPFWELGDTSIDLYNKITGLNPPPPSELRNEVPDELDTIILRMLGKSPHLRYRTCDQLAGALNKLTV